MKAEWTTESPDKPGWYPVEILNTQGYHGNRILTKSVTMANYFYSNEIQGMMHELPESCIKSTVVMILRWGPIFELPKPPKEHE